MKTHTTSSRFSNYGDRFPWRQSQGEVLQDLVARSRRVTTKDNPKKYVI